MRSMQEKGRSVLLANFSFIDNIKPFLNYLYKEFGIDKCDVFIYNINKSNKFFITFKLSMDPDEKVDLKRTLPNSIPIHKKGEAFYTLNALNRLIEEESDIEVGNIDHRSVEVDWSSYQNKIILLENDELVMHDIVKVF